MSDDDNNTTDDKNKEDKEPPTKIYKKESTLGSALTDTTEEMGPTQDNVEFSASEDKHAPINKQGTIQNNFHINGNNNAKKSGFIDLSVPLPTYFKHTKVALFGNFDAALKKLLFRYVTAYAGEMDNKITDKTTHIITNLLWDKELQHLQDKYLSACIVRPSWVFDSHNEQRKVDFHLHSVQKV